MSDKSPINNWLEEKLKSVLSPVNILSFELAIRGLLNHLGGHNTEKTDLRSQFEDFLGFNVYNSILHTKMKTSLETGRIAEDVLEEFFAYKKAYNANLITILNIYQKILAGELWSICNAEKLETFFNTHRMYLSKDQIRILYEFIESIMDQNSFFPKFMLLIDQQNVYNGHIREFIKDLILKIRTVYRSENLVLRVHTKQKRKCNNSTLSTLSLSNETSTARVEDGYRLLEKIRNGREPSDLQKLFTLLSGLGSGEKQDELKTALKEYLGFDIHVSILHSSVKAAFQNLTIEYSLAKKYLRYKGHYTKAVEDIRNFYKYFVDGTLWNMFDYEKIKFFLNEHRMYLSKEDICSLYGMFETIIEDKVFLKTFMDAICFENVHELLIEDFIKVFILDIRKVYIS